MSYLTDVARHYEASCPHEVAHLGLAAALSARAGEGPLWLVSGAGCSTLIHAYLALPCVAAPFGRGPSVARGLLFGQPEAVPVVYAGEGELVGEGLADLVRAAAADAPILVISVSGLGDVAGTCARPGADRESLGLDPVTVLAPFACLARQVSSAETSEVADALSEGLAVVEGQRRFALVRVTGACPAVGRES